MTNKTIYQRPINPISSFYILGHLLCEGYLYPLNTPILVQEKNKDYSFCLAFNKETDKVCLAGIDAPASVIETLAKRLKEIFVATLDNMEIKIEFINICNFGKKTVASLNKKLAPDNITVKFFDNPFQAYEYLVKENSPHNFPSDETIEACWDYMDTTIQYLHI